MAVIMLVEDESGPGPAMIEAAIELSRSFGAEICCIDRQAGFCAAPQAIAIRGHRQSPPEPSAGLCDICLKRDAEQCNDLLASATFIVSSSTALLIRMIERGYGPVLMLPPSQSHFSAAGRAMVVASDSPHFGRALMLCQPLLDRAAHVDVMGKAGDNSLLDTCAELLTGHGITAAKREFAGAPPSFEEALRAVCRQESIAWCLLTPNHRGGSTLDLEARQLLYDPPCPLLVAQ